MYLRQYETVILVDPDSGQDGIDKVLERSRDAFKKTKAQEIRVENWGVRKLAYELNRRKRGAYLYMQFLGSNATVAELERLLKITEPAFKYQTLVVNPQVDAASFDFKSVGAEQTLLAKKAVEAAEAKAAQEKAAAEKAASQPAPEVVEAAPAEEAVAEEAPAAEEAAEEAPAAEVSEADSKEEAAEASDEEKAEETTEVAEEAPAADETKEEE